MVSVKMLLLSLCVVSFFLLLENVTARPADESSTDGKHKHTHKIGGGGKHVHKIEGDGGEGGKHVHKISEGGAAGGGGDGGKHVHKISEGGAAGGGGEISEGGAAGGGGGGGQDVPKLFENLDPSIIEKLKSQKYGHFGVDSTKPKGCDDEYYFNDGVLKHFVRGTRDAGDALFSGLNNIIQGVLPEIGPVDGLLDGTKLGLQDILCGGENIFSDFADDFDSATHIAKNGLIDAFKFQGPGLLAIPEGIVGIGGEALQAAGSGVADAVSGIGTGIGDLIGAI